ncbi:hypothetical protein J2Z19_005468 [Ensifer adhaerens]|uniref:Uncharacterized protein n=1 Tax=Ensifer adhaerens TaxID=106592 RepID=A0ACC5T3L0_ENSAD|nr:HNH endonuclease signature motif containing protein [Ensifer adhaerens]MBP1875731.1 hypothetical protein [Ensifer adhaerens]
MTLLGDEPSHSDQLLSTFVEEREVEYGDERYLVRDNGAIYRRNPYRRKARPLDNVWTFGRQSLTTGYIHIAGVPVHRIVCSAFAGAPPFKTHVVDHIDTNRANNRAENLRWLSRLENVLLNPISARRIELVYGSIQEFLNNPQRVSEDIPFPDISWMRTVSKDEASATRERLEKWAQIGAVPSGGALGEWLYGTVDRVVSEPDPEEFESLTPSAVQVRWRVPSEFPECPEFVTENALKDYAARLSFGSVFVQNKHYKSVVVQCGLAYDSLVVLTHLPDNSIKNWAVAHVSVRGELFYHRSESSFFELQGALKRFCELTGQSYEDAFDDYC